MELNIKSVENGFILSWQIEEEEGVFKEVQEVIEGTDSEQEEMKRLLEFVAEYFGCYYDKFKANNLNISFDKKGHKLE